MFNVKMMIARSYKEMKEIVSLTVIRLLAVMLLSVLVSYISSSQILPRVVPEINDIDFKGNDSFDDDQLREVIQSKQSPSGFSKFMYRTFGEKLGSKPEYFDALTFEGDIERLKQFYADNGFYSSLISTETEHDTAGGEINLLFVINEQKRSFIDSIIVHGLDSLSEDLRNSIAEDKRIQQGDPYVKLSAASEIARVLTILANNGYPAAKFDAEQSTAKRLLSTNNFVLELYFNAGMLYQFGNVAIHVDPPREDITEEIILRQMDFQTGETYSREKKFSSERNINRLGLFETGRLEHPNLSDSTGINPVPIQIYVRPRPRNELSPEIIFSDENNAFNLGIGLGYTNRNFFGDARSFNARIRARSQDIQRWNLKEVFGGRGFRDPSVVGAVELQAQILQPYFFTRSLSFSLTTTLSAEKQSEYILSILRNKIGLSNQFATYTFGLAEWTLERVSPEFLQDTLNTALILANRKEEDLPQFNSILTLTLQRDKTNDIFSPTGGFFNSISLEESGILPKLLPGIRAGLPFTQYYKVTLSGRWYQDLTNTRYNIFALKLKSGYQDKYGESRYNSVNIPLNRRFFAGGSGSVRGWKARDLGAMPDELLQFGGNFIFEGSVEMRINYFRGFGKLAFLQLDNFWGVYFLDFGNVWQDVKDVSFNDVAVAAGIGIRYETFFGPFRVDYGFRLYNPKEAAGRQTIFQRRFFGETLNDAILHFGIGHAF